MRDTPPRLLSPLGPRPATALRGPHAVVFELGDLVKAAQTFARLASGVGRLKVEKVPRHTGALGYQAVGGALKIAARSLSQKKTRPYNKGMQQEPQKSEMKKFEIQKSRKKNPSCMMAIPLRPYQLYTFLLENTSKNLHLP